MQIHSILYTALYVYLLLLNYSLLFLSIYQLYLAMTFYLSSSWSIHPSTYICFTLLIHFFHMIQTLQCISFILFTHFHIQFADIQYSWHCILVSPYIILSSPFPLDSTFIFLPTYCTVLLHNKLDRNVLLDMAPTTSIHSLQQTTYIHIFQYILNKIYDTFCLLMLPSHINIL